jgi:uncharacterized protein YjbI with pentapeptide repeats
MQPSDPILSLASVFLTPLVLASSAWAVGTSGPMPCHYQDGFTPQDSCKVAITDSEITVELTEYQRSEAASERVAQRRRSQPEAETLNFSIPLANVFALSLPAQVDENEPAAVTLMFVENAADSTSVTRFLHLNAPNAVVNILAKHAAMIDSESHRATIRDRLRTPAASLTGQAAIEQLLDTKVCGRCDLRNADLSQAKLSEANLAGANLEGADLSGAKLRDANLLGANLDNANLTGADVTADLNLASLRNANLTKADMPGATLQYTNLENATLAEAELNLANLRGAILTHAILEKAELQGAVLRQANLEGANLEGANLTDYRLYGTNSTLAGLAMISLPAAIISSTVPSETISTDLTEANLKQANLKGTELDSAILDNAVLSGANLTDAQIRDSDLAILNLCGATLPDGNQSRQGC